MRRREQGFTLLEAIVTLVIAALVVTVLMQALQQAIGLRTRLLRHDREARLDALQEQWFRDTVHAAQSDFDDAMGPMRGDGSGVSFVSAAPLGGSGMARVTWRLEPVEGGDALVYGDDRWSRLQVVAGPLRDAAFSYLDAHGAWVDEWNGGLEAGAEPPAEELQPGTPASLPALPRMLRLEATTASGHLLWLVAVPAEPRAPVELRPEGLGIGL